ncbi:hypothetical protein DMUE_5113 [Dictyocoela muelleri]|nr:hypothetical protein DMUE_5113 [Dictyocoela muelleri]
MNKSDTTNKNKIFKGIKKLNVELLHSGEHKMTRTLKRYIDIKGLGKFIDRVCKNCLKCNQEKELRHNYGIVKNEFNLSRPGKMVVLDIKGPIKGSHFVQVEKDFFYILTMVDIYSRYRMIDIIYDIRSSTICKSFEKVWLSNNENPDLCLTDNGRQFIAEDFKNKFNKNNIKHITSAPNNPTGNSIVERVNKEIGLVLRMSRGM